MAKKMPSKMPLANQPEVQAVIGLLRVKPLSLRNYHAIGEHLMALPNRVGVVGLQRGWRKQVAAIVGRSEETLNKCCQFFKKYEEPQLQELEELGIGWGLLTVALAVPNIKMRHRLLRKAKDKGWSNHDVQRAIQGKRGSRRGGGRPRKRTQSHGLLADLCDLMRLTEHWLDFQLHWSAHFDKYKAQLAQLPNDEKASLSQLLRDAVAVIKNQRRHSEEILKLLEDLQGKPAPES